MADTNSIRLAEAADARQRADRQWASTSAIRTRLGPRKWSVWWPNLPSQLTDLARQNQELCETQRQLEDYRDRYIDLYDFAPLGYASLDEDGYIQEINLAGAKLLGMDRNTLTGYPFVDYVAKDDIPAFLAHVRQCIQQRSRGDFRGGPGRRVAGSRARCSFAASPSRIPSTRSSSARRRLPTSPPTGKPKRRCGKAKNGSAWPSRPRAWGRGTTI